MEDYGDYADKVKQWAKCWDSRIERLEFEARRAGQSKQETYTDEINRSITARESVRRGLLRFGDFCPFMCVSCPD